MPKSKKKKADASNARVIMLESQMAAQRASFRASEIALMGAVTTLKERVSARDEQIVKITNAHNKDVHDLTRLLQLRDENLAQMERKNSHLCKLVAVSAMIRKTGLTAIQVAEFNGELDCVDAYDEDCG